MVIMQIKRLFKHLLFPDWKLTKIFPAESRGAIEQAIMHSETSHAGELRFIVETSLDLQSLLQNKTAKARALEVFSELRIWDTENNNGVLIYILLAEKSVEIITDRGIAKKVNQNEWETICRNMEISFAKGEYSAGAVAAIESVSHVLQRSFPRTIDSTNELANQPVFIS